MIYGSNQSCASLHCVVCHDLADRIETTSTGLPSTVDVGTSTDEADLDAQETNPPTDRVARAKRALEESERRVKKARVEAKRDQLRMKYVLWQERLDQCVLAIEQKQEDMEDCPVRLIKAKQQDLQRLQDSRQLILTKLVEAEEAILDYQEDEVTV